MEKFLRARPVPGEALLKFLNALTDGGGEGLAQLLGVNTEVRTLTMRTTPAERHAALVNQYENMVKTMTETPRFVQNLCDGAANAEDECEKHRIKPRDGRDWAAVNMFICQVFMMHREVNDRFLRIIESALSEMSEKAEMDLTPSTRREMLTASAEMLTFDAILASHFQILYAKGEDNMADLHYERIVGVARGNLKAQTEGVKEACDALKRETPVARKADRSDVSTGSGNRRRRGRASHS